MVEELSAATGKARRSIAQSTRVSLSLGLIVTELVINALKHAFPGRRKGRIVVDYRSEGSDWTLSVSDDGIGIRDGAEAPKPGLGTGIVDALSAQVYAKIRIIDTQPGTSICVEHVGLAEVGHPAPRAA